MAVVLGILLSVTAPMHGQELDVRAELMRRGAPPDFADRVAQLVTAAHREGLPHQDIANKALEGWAKRRHVPSERVLVALEGLMGAFRAGRDAARMAGISAPPMTVISSAGLALARGMTREQIADVIHAAPTPEQAAGGLAVASSLGAQGLEHAAAVRAVNDAFRDGSPPEHMLELPSVIANLIARGVPMSDVARSILEGRGVPGGPGVGIGPPGNGVGRPPGVPPGRGPPNLNDLPGKAKGQGKNSSA
jgi:hypothetical protein